MRHCTRILNEGNSKRLHTIAQQRHVAAFGGKQAFAYTLRSKTVGRQQTAVTVLHTLEVRLAVPQCIVGIEHHGTDVSGIYSFSHNYLFRVTTFAECLCKDSTKNQIKE